MDILDENLTLYYVLKVPISLWLLDLCQMASIQVLLIGFRCHRAQLEHRYQNLLFKFWASNSFLKPGTFAYILTILLLLFCLLSKENLRSPCHKSSRIWFQTCISHKYTFDLKSQYLNFHNSWYRIALLLQGMNLFRVMWHSKSCSTNQKLIKMYWNWAVKFLHIFIGTEFCLCTAYYGFARNLPVYLKTELFEDNFTAAANASTWNGTCFLMTLIGAYLADSYWGNYLTVVSFMFIFFTVSNQFSMLLSLVLMIRLYIHTLSTLIYTWPMKKLDLGIQQDWMVNMSPNGLVEIKPKQLQEHHVKKKKTIELTYNHFVPVTYRYDDIAINLIFGNRYSAYWNYT